MINMKYSIQPRSAEGINAGTKAVKDTSKILNREGYVPFFVGSNYNGNHLYRLFILLYDFIRLYYKSRLEDVFFIQWPYYNYVMPLFYWIVKRRCNHVQLLIHDVNSLRGEVHGKWDFKFFQLSELIIAHSNPMKSYLVDNGIPKDQIRVLTSFDYITNDIIGGPRKNSDAIVYAGNLKKSTFLSSIPDDLGITINCYGKAISGMSQMSKSLVYKTSFQPEHVSVLEGSWGLVWDGMSLDGCVGEFGDYLKFNAPHKLSLYIVAEIPVIIWESSALASYVEEKKLGITISSIREIKDKIGMIPDEEYQMICQNVKKESMILRDGGHLKKCLNK